MAPTSDVVCLPVKLDAYMLNASACGTFPDATLAPLAQPNFTWLRMDSALMEPDCLPYHDLHNASPASSNPRLTDLGTGAPRPERMGIYLHWMLPRIYRSGSAEDTGDGKPSLKAPKFHFAPDRWLVLRRLHPGSFQPADAVSSGKVRWVEGWVVESNRIRNITEFGDEVDIEMECAPFVSGDSAASLEAQAEIFIGAKTNVVSDKQHPDGWHEQRQSSPSSFVPLNVAGASNPLFADYTPHNPNVFSIVDNFQYYWPDPANPKDKPLYLTEATASYCVLGWHSAAREDNLSAIGKFTLSQIFEQCFLQLMDPKSFDMSKPPPVRALCHGAMYSVRYMSQGNQGLTVPAHTAAQKLADPSSHPVTVGTTPIDAIIAYVRAHTGTSTETETDILHLDTLLLKTDDDIDSQQEALDMRTAHNFKPAQSSGSHWHFVAAQASGNAPQPSTGGSVKTQAIFEPTPAQQQELAVLNAVQSALDSTATELRQARWNLWAHWWKFVGDGGFVDLEGGLPNVQAHTAKLATAVTDLQARVDALTAALDTALVPLRDPNAPAPPPSPSKQPQREKDRPHLVQEGSSSSRFYLQNDPTILVPGIENPWPADWLNPNGLMVRMGSQIVVNGLPQTLPAGWGNLPDLCTTQLPKRMPDDIQATAATLVREFFNLHPNDGKDDSWQPQNTNLNPLYHDGRDMWNSTQPYFPLFLEYEVRYYHLEYDLWRFENPDVDTPHGTVAPFRYGLDPDKDIAGKTQDETVITGRILILPQPGFVLSKNIDRLFKATPPDELPDNLRDVGSQEKLKHDAVQLRFLSAPLDGFKNHLITMLNGIHVKPSVRLPGQPLQPLRAAIAAGQDAGFGNLNDPNEPKNKIIPLMGIETTKTPYADYVDFPVADIDPLKPVTHGQFKFTRLDIFDKFGQTISAINPAPARTIPALNPALSEYFHPQHLKGDPKQAKTVEGAQYASCQFAQFPPTINQESRMNASFLHFDDDLGAWRPCTEWENPIWGFLVVNYAEYAVQVFLPDGTFYREARRGGRAGDDVSARWKPLDPPTDGNGTAAQQHPQLDKLITKLRDKDYLSAMFATIDEAIKAVPHTPDAYAEFLNAVVGRPLALANAGFSLELAAPPVLSQATTSDYPQPTDASAAKLLDYQFRVKIGDRDRVYDGMVGYFDSYSAPQPGSGGFATPGTELDLDTLLTYFPAPGSAATTGIGAGNHPIVQPYHLSATTVPLMHDAASATSGASALAKQHWAQLQKHMFGALMDPFSKLHLYSGILPVAELQLPAWSLQAAMRRMTTFFHCGPLLVTNGSALVHDLGSNLTPDYNIASLQEVEAAGDDHAPPGSEAAKKKPVGVPLPAVKSADWNWLGPFAVPKDSSSPGSSSRAGGGSRGSGGVAAAAAPSGKETVWNPFVIASLDNKPKFEKGPYMAIEGFLQLKHPITAPDTHVAT
ncbi:hypothetical protein QBC46DRAFT_437333 [Diplogelasinospora grovesii]|uniref:Uncharacterized protein n=1 Tax=Diplogelasinospora grovesii TaxID=303347 RepID=A0AAN6S3X3_9PEZI|nr:hypothetical protein QBC46DRAFT_437333 [Diplogelasinospora grovesii]